MERYESYKGSGVEWIGEIPEHWKLVNLGAIVSRRKKLNSELKEQNVLSLSYGCIKRKLVDNTGLLPASFETYNVIDAGDIVLRLTDLQNDQRSLRVGLAMERGIITSAYVTLRPLHVKPKYFFYVLASFDYWKGFYGLAGGVRQSLTFDGIKSLRFPLASSKEQQAISEYLDRKTSEIDSLIQKTEMSIELLQEYRKSVISEAVTKGLDPNVPMKDSGVEWIGEIPKDWDVARIKSIVRSVDEESIDVPLHAIMLEDIQSWTGKLISESDPNNIESNSRSFIRGDILFSKLRPYLAKAITAPFDGVCSGELLVLRSTVLVHKFLFYFLLSFGFIDEINAATYGAKMPRANWNIVGLTFLSYPEKEEQIAIAEYLDAKTVEIDSLIEKKKQLVEKIQEYRKSLISECVTGKVKVPGVE